MTVTITQAITDITGVDDNSVVWFSQSDTVRSGGGGTTLVTTRRVSARPVSGTLTVELEPGPCDVTINGRIYSIIVPDADAPLLTLIEAGLPDPPPPGSAFVRNFGGVTAIQVIAQSDYQALSPPDPETLYIVVPDA